MSKPLTIEELKALQVGDWVWVEDLNDGRKEYCQFFGIEDDAVMFEDGKILWAINFYGTDWVVYNNNEQSCVICHKDISNELSKVDVCGNKYCKECYSEKCYKEQIKVLQAALDLCEQAYLLAVNGKQNEGISIQAMVSDLGIHKFFLAEAERRLAELKGD